MRPRLSVVHGSDYRARPMRHQSRQLLIATSRVGPGGGGALLLKRGSRGANRHRPRAIRPLERCSFGSRQKV
jgi:hypothetical protein